RAPPVCCSSVAPTASPHSRTIAARWLLSLALREPVRGRCLTTNETMAEHGMLVEWPAAEAPLASTEPLIDVHAHFLHAGCGRSDWSDVNRARLRAGERMGITCHVASILGSWGHGSPVYFPS